MADDCRGALQMLPQLTELVEKGTFGPETICVLKCAFETAWGALLASGAPFAQPEYHDTASDILIRSIIQAAENGERDERKLSEAALLQLSKATLRKRR
jgi:hypothetical protein